MRSPHRRRPFSLIAFPSVKEDFQMPVPRPTDERHRTNVAAPPPKIAFNFHQSIQFSSIFFRAYHWVPKANNDTSEFGSQGWAVAELLMIKRPWLRIHRAKEDEMQVLAVLDPFSWRVGSLFRGIHEQAICRTEENKSWLIGFWGNF